MLTVTDTSPSGLQFELSDDQQMLQTLARDFARKEIIPRAEHYDQSGEWPWDVFH
ncbi:MAG: acyl-CoA dehydrogenase family protein, partial [Caldilineaceae bacterium]|nr:acyl-CoA dehydrogenase family protein [Caldilineaceae bacterium]